jgi:RHS repeat-associated protein
VTDEGGMTVQSFEYDEFGNVLGKVSNTDVDYLRLFTGREYEEELGLYYYRARFYDPLK